MHGREGVCEGACMVGGHVWWGSMCGGGAYVAGGACMVGCVEGACMVACVMGGHVWWGGMHRGRSCMVGGMHGRGGMRGRKMPIAAGSMHATGMHSCYNDSFSFIDFVQFCVDFICYRLPTKLREGNVFLVMSVCLFSHDPSLLAAPDIWWPRLQTSSNLFT